MYKPRFIISFLLILLAISFLLSSLVSRSQISSFNQLTNTLFKQEVTASTLTLHYSLLSPEKYGINSYPVTYGSDSSVGPMLSASGYLDILKKIPRKDLSPSDQLTYDILFLVFQNAIDAEEFSYYAEPLGPTLGIQAQLPILLSEYRFHTKTDIQIYLQLLSKTDSYFSSLLSYERKKSALGLFMNDRCADSVIRQCQSFIAPDLSVHLLSKSFCERLSSIPGLSRQEYIDFQQQNLQILSEHVIPAYQLLIHGLNDLKGTGKNTKGLFYFSKGKAYYEYLIKTQTGSYLPVLSIQNRIEQQIKKDFNVCKDLLRKYPDLLVSASIQFESTSPETLLDDLKQKMLTDYPDISETNYELKYVPSSLEPFLSPAFYLTAPIDNRDQNIVYINHSASYTPLTLYTTLAHEAFPGHLYQHLYSSPYLPPIRSLLSFGGYTEGWATYTEMESYSFASIGCSEKTAAFITYAQKSKSLLLGISSLMDISIHYHGYSQKDVQTFLSGLGMKNEQTVSSLYDMILESPCNYLKYYLGYLSFLDLRSYCEKKWPEKYQLKDFHRRVLEIGPCPFPILEKYIKASYQ